MATPRRAGYNRLAMPRTERFDRAYYDRFYRDPCTRVTSEAVQERLARFVAVYLEHLDIPLRTVLDVGCGLGGWRDALQKVLPSLDYTGLEVSSYLCEEYGWSAGSVVDHEPGRSYDLVVCQGVLQYLTAGEVQTAVENLATWTLGALYLEVLTRKDWHQNCDQATTDGDVTLRYGSWYRRVLAPHFISCGGGLFLPRDTDVVLFDLERAE